MARNMMQKEAAHAIQDPEWDRIQALSDELVETAEAGDWTRLLALETEWLAQIKQFLISHAQRKNKALPVDYLENLLTINQDLYRQCQGSRKQLESNIVDIRLAKKGVKQVKESYGDF